MKMKLKKGDKVIVTSGKDKGKTGTIERVSPSTGMILVEGIAIKKRHMKGTRGTIGQIVESPRMIDASNVMFYDAETKKGTRTPVRSGKKA